MPDSKITMTSSRPYLVRAFNEWILDNDCTPYIVVDAGVQGVQVPTEHVANGQIVLNISPGAVRGLVIGNGALEFSARFGGVPMQVFIPCRLSWLYTQRRTVRVWSSVANQALLIRKAPAERIPRMAVAIAVKVEIGPAVGQRLRS